MVESPPESAAGPASSGGDLASLRDQIDALDARMLDLLNRRAELALEIGRIKLDGGRPIYDPKREAALLDRLAEANGGPLPEEAVRLVYQRIIQACRNLESPPRVAFLGPRGTFSHQAALTHAGPGIEAVPMPDLPDVAEAVARGEVDMGMLPVENSIEGVIGTTFDLVAEHRLHIVGELVLPVHLFLVGSRELDGIERVYSHPQPLRQARHWLRGHLPKARQIAVGSTAEAAAKAGEEPAAAAIVGPMLVDENELPTLAGPIEDRPHNRTRFWVVGREPRREGSKSSVLLSLAHEPGSLASTLNTLAAAGINLQSISSRPAPSQPWEYRFFIDLDGNAHEEPIQSALAKLTDAGAHVRVLGVYDPAEEVA